VAETEEERHLTWGRNISLGMLLIFAGMMLIAAASLISVQGGGVIIIPPFFVGTVEGGTLLLILILLFFMMAVLIFLPWILGIMRTSLAEAPTEGETLEGNQYIITLHVPECDERNIDIQAFNGNVTVKAYIGGEVALNRNYQLPPGFKVRSIHYKCEDGYLVIRVNLEK